MNNWPAGRDQLFLAGILWSLTVVSERHNPARNHSEPAWPETLDLLGRLDLKRRAWVRQWSYENTTDIN